uniref:AB hydrolase-1 domain-containing protein n=1 Tax=Tetradesmus obliquus TaxID=3088 RepID=A0A383VZY8_TETOB|eukprot:jgi/Sobl393_1/18053/SZX71008.1
MHYKELISQYSWAFLWLPPIATIATAVLTHRTSQQASSCPASSDVEANTASTAATRPVACSKAAWRKCWVEFWAFCGWSSMFWLAFLGFFLALQAAWLVNDQRLYPPPGQLYQVDLQDGSSYKPSIHMLCKGPTNTGLSTFVMEGGGGSPGVQYAGLVDELAAAGRRACWYDRLGCGWSSDAFLYPSADQAAVVLHNTLQAAGEAGPFIIAGHSVGGQLALAFAGWHPDIVSGIALLDSYDDVAIALGYLGSREVNVTLPSGRTTTRPALSQTSPALVSVLDIVRAVTPLAWARFITMNSGGSYPYQGARNAMYGNNKEWHAQWVVIASEVHGVAATSDQLADVAYNLSGGTVSNLFHGTAWPDFSPKPVLLLPAEKTLAPGVPGSCDVFALPTDAACRSQVASCTDKQCVYPSLYVRYLQTLSSNVSMTVMPGGHEFPWATYKETAAALLAKFAGV